MEQLEELIFDRLQSDLDNNTNKAYYNYSDLNRVESWIEFINNEFISENYIQEILVVKKDWNAFDFPTIDDIERIRQNIYKLKKALICKSIIPSTMNNMTISKANTIEKILNELNINLNQVRINSIKMGVAEMGNDLELQRDFRTYYERS